MGPTLASQLRNAECILPTATHHLECPHITVSDLMATTQKQWNMELINGFFDHSTSIGIFNTPILPSVIHDMPTWKLEKDGGYMVKSVYMNIMNHNF